MNKFRDNGFLWNYDMSSISIEWNKADSYLLGNG